MRRTLLAKIGVENCVYSFDELFTFKAEGELCDRVVPGVRVLVPFGRSNAKRQGFVFFTEETSGDGEDGELKQIIEVIDSEPLLNDELIELALVMRERTFSTYFSCAKAMLPGGMFRLDGSVRGSSVKMISLSPSKDAPDFIKLTEKQRAVADYLKVAGSASVKEILYYTGASEAVVKGLIKKGMCVVSEIPVNRRPEISYKTTLPDKAVLSVQQRKAFEKLYDAYRSQRSETALLYGITGSGKTSVYLSLIDKVLEDGKNVIVLVPEISLTPQTVSLFSKRYGDKIAVMHSALSAGERRDEYYRIKNGEASVVIGTRSAVFAPLEDIGAVIIDEEQEHTYKSEMSPRYDARAVARFRCQKHNALLVLASATPSVESYARAKTGKYILCTLSERYGDAVLPDVLTVDMTDKSMLNAFSAISEPLFNELEKNLNNSEQSILLVNRRGYNTFVVCKECKNVISCPKCSISMTYHSDNNRLMCHYCGYSTGYMESCPVCGNENIRYSGFGTQRVEQELNIRFPGSRVLRMDADTTTAKNSHSRALSAFANGSYDILIGTQMVAKGLDFPRVTLVGIINADNELYGGDFRGSEKTFDLVTQVIGRAGRGDKKGRAVIQTVSPGNMILSLAAKQDYTEFFKSEIAVRKAMIYPPYCDICLVSFSSEDKDKTWLCAEKFFEILRSESEGAYADNRIIVLGPLAPRVSRINNLYRQKIIIKCVNSPEIRDLINKVLKTVYRDRSFAGVNIFAAMDPDRTD